MSDPFLNRRFGRYESSRGHIYPNWQWRGATSAKKFEGYLKCRLIHSETRSVIQPDMLFLNERHGLSYIQPHNFFANWITFKKDDNICYLHVGISAGVTVLLTFRTRSFIQCFPDGSQLFECEIDGPTDLSFHATGEAVLIDGSMWLNVFHHTNKNAKSLILNCGYLRSGNFNIQGTTKLLKDRAYVYFTGIDKIKFDDDLKAIAMARDGKIHLMVDKFQMPSQLLPGWEEYYKDEVLALDVYKSSPDARCESLGFWVESSAFSANHLWSHDGFDPAFYEVANPWIMRVGLPSGVNLPFDNRRNIPFSDDLINLDYVIVGDATCVEGLAAPYDEEATGYVWKVQRCEKDILTFWKEHSNQPLYRQISVNLQEFDS